MNLRIGRTACPHVGLWECTLAIALSLACVAASGARGEAKMPGPLFAGMRVGYVPGCVSMFSDCTRREQLIDAFLGIRARRCLTVQSTLMYHGYSDADCRESPPIPTHGPYTWIGREFEAGVGRYPYYSSEINVIAEPLPAQWVASIRLLAGYGWIWTKDIPMWLAGGGIAAGNTRVRIVLDVKKYWFDVPYERVTYHYQDGVLVDGHAVPRHSNEHPYAIMAGLELGLPWFK